MRVDKAGLTLIALWIHVPFVTAWIGLVLLDLLITLAPGLQPVQRGQIIAWSKPFVILAVVVIMITGVWQTIYNPFNEASSYEALERLRTTTVYGMVLFWKHGFVLATFVLTYATRFVLAPRLVAAPTADDGDRILRSIRGIAAANVAACLGALLLATRMVWELH
jgi:uncharacterized membrane protein